MKQSVLQAQLTKASTAKIVSLYQKEKLTQHTPSPIVSNLPARTIDKIAVPNAEGWDFVHVDDILYLQANGNYTQIHFIDKRKSLIARTLKSFEHQLHHDQYFRSHQTYLVNINHVNKFYRGSGGYLLLDSGDKIPVARSRREALSKKMGL